MASSPQSTSQFLNTNSSSVSIQSTPMKMKTEKLKDESDFSPKFGKALKAKRKSVAYIVSFEDVFDNPDLRECFLDYLSGYKNEEPLLFLLEVEEYKRLKSEKNLLKKAKELLEEFVKVGSVSELNLSQDLRNKIEEEYNSCVTMAEENKFNSAQLRQLFDTAQGSVFLELKQDSFPRFLESKIFKQLMSSKRDSFILDVNAKKIVRMRELSTDFDNASFRNNINAILGKMENLTVSPSSTSSPSSSSPQAISLFHSKADPTPVLTPRSIRASSINGSKSTTPQTPKKSITTPRGISTSGIGSNFSANGGNGGATSKITIKNSAEQISAALVTPMVSEEEFVQVVKDGLDFDDWDLVTNKDNFQSYVSKKSYTIKNKAFKKVKRVGIVPYEIEDVLYAVVSSAVSSKAKQLDFLTNENFACAISYEKYKFVFPIQDRDCVKSTSIIFDPEMKRYIVRFKSCTHHKKPPTKSHVRMTIEGSFIIERVAVNLSRYIHTIYVDPNGWFAEKFLQTNSQFREQALHSKLNKLLKNRKESGTLSSILPQCVPMVKTLHYYLQQCISKYGSNAIDLSNSQASQYALKTCDRILSMTASNFSLSSFSTSSREEEEEEDDEEDESVIDHWKPSEQSGMNLQKKTSFTNASSSTIIENLVDLTIMKHEMKQNMKTEEEFCVKPIRRTNTANDAIKMNSSFSNSNGNKLLENASKAKKKHSRDSVSYDVIII